MPARITTTISWAQPKTDRDLFDLTWIYAEASRNADRFGYYKVCCDPGVMSNSIVQSPEVWAGPEIRYAGVLLFDLVRIGGGVTFGLSVATHSIGNDSDGKSQMGPPRR